MSSAQADELFELLAQVKKYAQRYRQLTGKPLGVVGEVAEYEAGRILGLELARARAPGHDATRVENGVTVRFEIKGRCLEGGRVKGRVPKINVAADFDYVLLVLMDESLNATSIHRAERSDVISALLKPGSKARNERGQLAIAQFKKISRCIWERSV